MRIDVHAHYFPSEYLDKLESFGKRGTDGFRNLLAGKEPEALVARFGMMDRAGVDRQILSVGPQTPYFDDEANAVEAARLANDLYAEIVGEHPDRFLAFAVSPLPHVGAAIAEVGRGLDKLNMVGATVTCSVLGRSLADPEFEPFFAELERRACVLFLHPAGIGFGAQTELLGLTWVVGAPLEDTFAALHLILSGLTTRYPNIRVIVPHLGGTLPFILARVDNQGRRAAGDKIQEAPSALARRLWYDTVSHGSLPGLRCACEVMGPSQIVLGTDYPYLQGDRFQEAIDYVKAAGLPEADADAILDRNAELLLGEAIAHGQ